MGFITLGTLGASPWEAIINLFSFIPNFGWMLIVFTICLKLVLSPLDFWQRKVSRDSMKKQARLQPEMAKIKKQYGHNKQLENQKTMELYKKENYNILGSCLGMIVNMGLTLFIFITLFYALIGMSQVNITKQYNILKETFNASYEQSELAFIDPANPTQAELDAAYLIAGDAVILKYDAIKDTWLWVHNIWRPDNYASIFPNFNEYKGMTAMKAPSDAELTTLGFADADAWWAAQQTEYDLITGALRDANPGWNGLLILTILAAVVTFLSVTVTQAISNKKKGQALNSNDPNAPVNPAAGATKIMKFILPIVMVYFTLQYSAAFSVYIVTNSLMAVIFAVVFNKLFDIIDKKKEEKAAVNGPADYTRKDPDSGEHKTTVKTPKPKALKTNKPSDYKNADYRRKE